MSTLEVREFDKSDADYEMLSALLNRLNPNNRATAAEMKDEGSRGDATLLGGRWLGIADGEPVGTVSYSQMLYDLHPQKFNFLIKVLPERRGEGFGKALYARLEAELAPHDPISLRTDFCEDWPRSARFAQERGFVERSRAWSSRLDVNAFDPAPFAERRDKPFAHGIVIKTAGQLKAEDPGFARKLWELESEASLNIPTTEPGTPFSFETYHKVFIESPHFLNDGFLLAVNEADGEYAGLSSLWKSEGNDHLHTGFTGVRRKYRRMGIAFALKLRGIDYAKSVGAPIIGTGNATTNRPMLSINEALGFEKQPVSICIQKTFKQEETPAEAVK